MGVQWGVNSKGQCGTGDTTGRSTPTRIRVGGEETDLPIAVACGENHSAVITTQGYLYLFGNSSHGQVSPNLFILLFLFPLKFSIAWIGFRYSRGTPPDQTDGNTSSAPSVLRRQPYSLCYRYGNSQKNNFQEYVKNKPDDHPITQLMAKYTLVAAPRRWGSKVEGSSILLM